MFFILKEFQINGYFLNKNQVFILNPGLKLKTVKIRGQQETYFKLVCKIVSSFPTKSLI